MIDVFDLPSEISDKEKILRKFSEWWTEDEIRTELIPNIVDKKIKDSVNGALKNFEEKRLSKKFTEILYDLVGQNFLVNPDKTIRTKFLEKIIKKIQKDDQSFEKRFFEYLIKESKASSSEACHVCQKKWEKDEKYYHQRLGLEKAIKCSDFKCIEKQQEGKIVGISKDEFIDFLVKFKLNWDYKNLCRRLIDESGFPESVRAQPPSEINLLPESISPLGEFSHLHDYQASIGLQITEMLENYEKETSRGLVVLPTGAGKTRLVVETVVDWINNKRIGNERSKFVVWIVDKKELCQQAFDTFADVFRHRGRKDSSLKLHPIYDDNQKNIRDILYKYSKNEEMGEIGEIQEENGIIIASIASLYKLSQNEDNGSLPELGKYTSMVIIDEAHHAVPSNVSYNKVLKSLGFDFRNVKKKGVDINKNKTRLLGLTATPFRGSGDEGESTKALLNRFGGMNRILWPPFSDDLKSENIPPEAHLDLQGSAYAGQRVKIYGEKSYDKDGKIKSYRFKISKLLTAKNLTQNPVIHDESGEEKNIEFIFEEPGGYTVELYVTDDEGVESSNLAVRNIEIRPKLSQQNKSNLEEMKRLYSHLIKREILSNPHHYIINNTKVKIEISEKDIKIFEKFHDISNAKISEIGNDPFRNQKIIDKIVSLIEREDRQSILLFACSVQHSKLLSFILDAIYGIKSASIDSTTSKEERDQSIGDFRRGIIKVLCNYGILSTGFDSPKVDCVFIARPTFSHLLYNQMAGRGLRGIRSNGTSDCTIIDISDNIQLYVEDVNVKEPWKIFDYIYKTTFDERKNEDQKCYVCFGTGSRRRNKELQDCDICDSLGTIKVQIQEKAEFSLDEQRKREIFQKIRTENPYSDIKEIKRKMRKERKYEEIFGTKTESPIQTGPWTAKCKECGFSSNDMPLTLAKFNRSKELETEANPKGVSDMCKECENDPSQKNL